VKGAKILVCGVTYKRDIDDVRESPALDIIELLQRRGAQVAYHDSHVPHIDHGGVTVPSASLDRLAEFDCVVIATDHSDVDYRALVEKASLVVDTRNATRGLRTRFPGRIVLL